MRVWNMLAAALAGTVFSVAATAQGQVGHSEGSAANGRYLAVISDHHMGLGRDADGTWTPTEDFRWPRALKGFLDYLSQRGNHAVDLVIAGDLFELWQPPKQVKCVGISADLGCTVDEAVTIAEMIARAHTQELNVLAEFAERGDNRVHLIPGNHDAALLLDPVWQTFAKPLRADKGRVLRVPSGIWTSADGIVVVEHGHQIGADVNRYEAWPDPPVRSERDKTYVVRPWGERFVQLLFNEQEAQYPIIDNLSPETAGVRYRMADRGAWGSLTDLARFLAFNLFETSAAQKTAFLGAPKNEPPEKKWVLSVARKSGHRLFAAALPPGDPFWNELMANDEQAAALRKELDLLAADQNGLTDGEVRGLCDLAAANRTKGWALCRPATMGALVKDTLVPLSWQLREHLTTRRAEFKQMGVFIYGHTHAMQVPWRLGVNSSTSVVVANSGAFQRLIDEQGFIALVKARSWSTAEGLSRVKPEDLAACYGVILVPYDGARPIPEAKLWWMPEEETTGELVGPRDSRCR